MIRAGLGFDVHAFDNERVLVLGGVEIAEGPGLAGHSDADVVCHAVADALLGSIGRGDIGEMFPAGERWRDASSVELLRIVREFIAAEGWSVGNVDVTIAAERPRLGGYREAMRAAVARALDVHVSAVSIKSTTTDGLGLVGRGEGIAALALALVERP